MSDTDFSLCKFFKNSLPLRIYNDYVCFVEITVLQLFRATSIRLVCLRSFCSYIGRHLKINAIKAAWDASGRKYFVALFQTSKLHSLHGTNSRNGLWFYNFSRSNVNAVFTTVVSEMYTAALNAIKLRGIPCERTRAYDTSGYFY